MFLYPNPIPPSRSVSLRFRGQCIMDMIIPRIGNCGAETMGCQAQHRCICHPEHREGQVRMQHSLATSSAAVIPEASSSGCAGAMPQALRRKLFPHKERSRFPIQTKPRNCHAAIIPNTSAASRCTCDKPHAGPAGPCQRQGRHGESRANNFLHAACGLIRNDRIGIGRRGTSYVRIFPARPAAAWTQLLE